MALPVETGILGTPLELLEGMVPVPIGIPGMLSMSTAGVDDSGMGSSV